MKPDVSLGFWIGTLAGAAMAADGVGGNGFLLSMALSIPGVLISICLIAYAERRNRKD